MRVYLIIIIPSGKTQVEKTQKHFQILSFFPGCMCYNHTCNTSSNVGVTPQMPSRVFTPVYKIGSQEMKEMDEAFQGQALGLNHY